MSSYGTNERNYDWYIVQIVGENWDQWLLQYSHSRGQGDFIIFSQLDNVVALAVGTHQWKIT